MRTANSLWKDSIFNEFFRDPFQHGYLNEKIETTDESVELSVDIPGVKKEDVKLSVEDGVLYLKAQRGPDFAYKSSWKLNRILDTDNISADLENGVLSLKIAKKKEAQQKQILLN